MPSSLLSSTISNTARTRPQLLLLQSSTAQTCLPVLSSIVTYSVQSPKSSLLLFCFLYPPSSIVHSHLKSTAISVHDLTENVPGYSEEYQDPTVLLQMSVDSAPQGPVDVVIDSIDTLFSDLGSVAKTYKLLSSLLSALRSRNDSSRLILHVLAPSPLIPILVQPKFSPSLVHIISHPPALLAHLNAEYMTPPPPLSTPEKFWGVFIPIAERHYEAERLVFGASGSGSGSGDGEFVVEVLLRAADGSGRRRAVERVIEGWSAAKGGACELSNMESLRNVWTRKSVEESRPDPTQNLSFNLNLTPEQQQSRSQVPLPYAHEGKQMEANANIYTSAAILYDPDSADDLDDDDPDEDLDI